MTAWMTPVMPDCRVDGEDGDREGIAYTTILGNLVCFLDLASPEKYQYRSVVALDATSIPSAAIGGPGPTPYFHRW